MSKKTVMVTPRISEELATVLRMVVQIDGKESLNGFIREAIELYCCAHAVAWFKAPCGIPAARLADLRSAMEEAGFSVEGVRAEAAEKLHEAYLRASGRGV